jgi:hypothetical protein
MNVNVLNDKSAKFTDEEIKTLNFALQDILRRIGSINVSI